MEINCKKQIALTILALIIGFVAYNLAINAYDIATTANNTANNASGGNASNVTISGTNFSFNITGNASLYNYTILKAGGNISLTQDTANHTITINAMGGSSITLPTCNPANQALTTNGIVLSCVSITDDDSAYLLISTYGTNFPNDNDALFNSLFAAQNVTNNLKLNKTDIYKDYFIGDDATRNFTTTYSIHSGSAQVDFNGLEQDPTSQGGSYTEYSHSINLTSPLPYGWKMVVRYINDGV